jgi:hypothetical protein
MKNHHLKRVSSIVGVVLVMMLVLSAVATKWISGNRTKQIEIDTVRAQRDLVVGRFRSREDRRLALSVDTAMPPNTVAISQPDETTNMNALDISKVRPSITTNMAGRKTYFFAELYGTNNQVIARDAQFRELLGFTKLAFRTSEGVRYYDLDDLHPEVVRSVGYDAAVLKRALAEEFRQRQLLGAQAQLQADLRVKAAAEAAERAKAEAERTKAEAAIRDAEARERLAAAAERAATNPPRERITRKYLFVSPYSTVITNRPTLPPVQPPTQPSFPSIQPVPQ